MKSKETSVSFETEMRKGLDADEATRRARVALRHGDMGYRVAAFYLADIVDRRVYLDTSPNVRHFIRHKLKFSESKFWKLVRVGQALDSLPDINAEFAADRLCWTKVQQLVRIVTPETQGPWAEWAVPRTTRDVQLQVAKRDKGDLPTAPERRRIHEPKRRVGADLASTNYRLWSLGRAKLEEQSGMAVSDEDMMMFVVHTILRLRPDGTLPGWTAVNDRHYLLHAWPRGEYGTELVTVDENGEEVPVDLDELTNSVPRRPSGAAATGLGVAELGLDVLDPDNDGPIVPEDRRDAATSPAMRDEVLSRDGYCCRACGSKRNLTVHHRRWRSFGGKTVPSNLLALCEACHSLVHARLLIVLGSPTGELHFFDRKGRPIDGTTEEPIELPAGVAATPAPPLARPAEPLVVLDTLPIELDARAWSRHEHLFSWNERQGELVLSPGLARDVEGRPSAQNASPPQSAGGGLSALVGQSSIRERLGLAITAATERGEPLGHLLFVGSPGLGKTSLAQAVAADLKAPLTSLPAPSVRSPDVLVRTLASLASGGILFLDELHALPPRAAEVLYEAMDSGGLTLPVRQGLRVRTVRLRLEAFTIVGATTDPDQLPSPLRSRLRVLRLEPYTHDELTTLVVRAARARGFELEPDGAARVALASRDTPRRALALLRTVHDEVTVAGVSTADLELVARALVREGVDAEGLDAVERAYLRVLEQAGRPLGLSTLAARLDVSEEALKAVYEPLLLRRGLIHITPAGRVAASGATVASPVDHADAQGEMGAA